MELDDFIAETIAQIMRGVSTAIKSHDVQGLGGIINPFPASLEGKLGQRETQSIEFDVAITVESGTASTKGGGLNIKVIEAKLSKDTTEKTTGASRVRFSVPISLPYTTVHNA